MDWLRDEMPVSTDRLGRFLDKAVPRIRLHAATQAGPLRIGLWAGTDRVAGWSVPGIPAGTYLVIDGATATGIDGDNYRALPLFLRGWDGEWPKSVAIPHGTYRLTLDQYPDRAVDVLVDVTMTAMSE